MTGALSAMIAAAFAGGGAAVSDPYFEYTTLLLPGNGTNGAQNNTFLDSSTNNFTITRNGNTTQGTFSPFSQTGWGNYFSGSSQYLSFTDTSNNLDLGGSQASFECWVYPISTTNYQILFKYGGTGDWNTTNGIEYGLSLQSGVVYFYYNSSASAASINSGATTVSANTWTHIAVASNASNALSIYVNGTRVATTTAAITKPTTRTSMRIGVDISNYANGYMSNYRFITGSNAYDATLSSINVPTSPVSAVTGTQLLTCQSNRFRDASTNNFTITVNGSPSVQAFSPFNPSASWSAATYGGSGYFDGSGDYLTAPANSAFAFGTGDMTFEAWAYYAGTQGTFSYVTDLRVSGSESTSRFYVYLSGTTLYLGFGSTDDINVATGISKDQWLHIAVVRSGSGSNNVAVFVNGTRTHQRTDTSNFSTNAIPTIGARYGNTDFITGYIGSYRIVKGTAVYDPSQSTITVPTAPLTAITNTSLLLNYTNGGIYDATSKNDLETVGNAQISTTQSKWGGSSMYFDGTGDYLTNNNASNSLLAFGTGDFTIEGWFYSNNASSAAQRGMFQTSDTIGGLKTTYTTGVSMSHGATTGELNVNVGSTVYSTSGASITTGAWFYFAITRSSGNVNVYVNGVSRASGSGNTNNLTGTYISVGGYYSTSYLFDGYLQDFRITKGYARTITASPTAAFPTL